MRLPKYSSIRMPADLAVSWLNFEPKVSKFPAVSANVADTAHATIGSLFLFYGLRMFIRVFQLVINSKKTVLV